MKCLKKSINTHIKYKRGYTQSGPMFDYKNDEKIYRENILLIKRS